MKIWKSASSRGFTILEMLLVMAILAVLFSIAVPRYASYVKRGNRAKCISNMSAMEKQRYLENYTRALPPQAPVAVGLAKRRFDAPLWAFWQRAAESAFSPAWAVVATGPEMPFECPDGGVYVVSEDPEAENPVRVICSLHGEIRLHRDVTDQTGQGSGLGEAPGLEPGSGTVYDFSKMNNGELNRFDMGHTKNWKISDKNGSKYLLGDGWNERILLPNEADEYTLKVVATLGADRVFSSGYGILFDTSIANNDPWNDTGFIMQFDKGFGNGELVFRKRVNGKESSPFATIDPGHSDYPWQHNYDPEWWNREHEISLTVRRIDAHKKEVRVYIDGVEYAGEAPIVYDSGPGEGGYTGFRVWGGPSRFDRLEMG